MEGWRSDEGGGDSALIAPLIYLVDGERDGVGTLLLDAASAPHTTVSL